MATGPLEFLSDRGVEGINRFYSIYRGIVINNIDLDNQNRVEVIVPQINSSLSVWAYPKGQMAYNGAGSKTLVPPISSVVWIEYECGDPTYPVWSHGHFAVGEMPEDLLDEKVMGVVTPNQNKVIIDENENNLKIEIINNNGPSVTIEMKNGVVTINGGNNEGLVNIRAIRSLAQALAEDLVKVGSGTSLSKWMATDMQTELENPNVVH